MITHFFFPCRFKLSAEELGKFKHAVLACFVFCITIVVRIRIDVISVEGSIFILDELDACNIDAVV